MAKKGDDAKLIVYLLIGVAIGAALTYFLVAPKSFWGYGMMDSGMMYGQPGYGMMQYMQGYRSSANADCSNVTTGQFEDIGDRLMGQMIGNDTVHEQIDRSQPNMDQMHVMIGRMATGCY